MAGVVITTVVTVTNMSGANVATKLTDAANTVEAALINAGFLASVGPVTASIVANPSAIPTLIPSTPAATTDFNSKGKDWL